jgi:hypothetical protein
MLVNGVAWTPAGRYGVALHFGGSNDRVTVADHTAFDATDGIDVSHISGLIY